VLVFLPEIVRGTGGRNPALGIAFALGGALSASLGNIVASRNHGRGLPVVQMNTFGMLYGALFVRSLRSRPASRSCSTDHRAICSPSPTSPCSAPSWRSEPSSRFSGASERIERVT